MTTKNKLSTPEKLKIIPLGGLGEVGKNTWIFALGDNWIIVDAGLGFPFNEYPGVELILPNIDYLIENKDKLKALIITHAHEDHIGGVIRILSNINIPQVYASNLTIAVCERKFEEAGITISSKLQKVKPSEVITIGSFKVEFIRSTHSVPDCFALLIDTPVGKILFSGDFKFDFTPVDGEQFDITRLVEAGNDEIKLLISDSTNVEREGFSLSEKTVGPNLTKIFEKVSKRIFITTFSSHIHRIQQIINAAKQANKKVCILGYSMEIFTAVARETGYLTYPDNLVLPLEEILKLPENEIVIITTGSQGEQHSILARLARNEHKNLKLVPGDTIIFSTYPIPGNERAVSKLQDVLCSLGADLIYGRSQNVHVSGHACQEELKLMIALTRPKHFLPAHGDYRMLLQHAELAASMGIDPRNIYVLENGDLLELDSKNIAIVKNAINASPVYYDSILGGIVDDKILKDRLLMGQEGLILLFVVWDDDLNTIASIDLVFKGVTFNTNISEEKLSAELKDNIEKAFERMKKIGTADINNLRTISRDLIIKNTEGKLCCKPLILVFFQSPNILNCFPKSEKLD